jgi:hypothetical protein
MHASYAQARLQLEGEIMSKCFTYRTLSLALAVMATACGGAAESGSTLEEAERPSETPASREELVRTLEQNPKDSAAREALQQLDEQADIDFGLLHKMEAMDGHEVRFFEPSPGNILVLEKYDLHELERAPRANETEGPATIDRIWARVAGDAPMPQALVEAQARQVRWVSEAELQAIIAADKAPSQDGELPDAPASVPSEMIEKHVTSDGNHFSGAQNGCGLTGAPRLAQWCWRNVTGNWGNKMHDITGHSSALAMYAGNLMTWRTRFDDSLHFTTVAPGQFWSWQGTSGSTCALPGVCWMHDGYWNVELQSADLNVDLWHWGGSFSDAGWPGPTLPVYHPEL